MTSPTSQNPALPAGALGSPLLVGLATITLGACIAQIPHLFAGFTVSFEPWVHSVVLGLSIGAALLCVLSAPFIIYRKIWMLAAAVVATGVFLVVFQAPYFLAQYIPYSWQWVLTYGLFPLLVIVRNVCIGGMLGFMYKAKPLWMVLLFALGGGIFAVIAQGIESLIVTYVPGIPFLYWLTMFANMFIWIVALMLPTWKIHTILKSAGN